MRKPPASRSPKPAPTNSAPSPRRPALHRADQGPVRNQRTGPLHTTLIVNPNDAVIGKINAGQHPTRDPFRIGGCHWLSPKCCLVVAGVRLLVQLPWREWTSLPMTNVRSRSARNVVWRRWAKPGSPLRQCLDADRPAQVCGRVPNAEAHLVEGECADESSVRVRGSAPRSPAVGRPDAAPPGCGYAATPGRNRSGGRGRCARPASASSSMRCVGCSFRRWVSA